MHDRFDSHIAYFESLSRERLASIAEHYASDCYFKDPFNEVRGLASVQRIYAHMFDALYAPRFRVRERVAQGHQCFLTWDFLFGMKRYLKGEQCIHGGTLLTLNEAGLITHHRDYWDTGQELYEKLPLLGAVMRRLRRAQEVA